MPPRTPSQTVGPFFAIGLCREAQYELVAGGPVRIHGRVVGADEEPVTDALVELWQPAADGGTLWGRCGTDAGGRFEFVTEKPGPAEGEAPAIDVLVFARGLLRHLATRIYFPDEDAANATDPLLSSLEPSRRRTLVARADGDGTLCFDVRLQGALETVFLDL